MRVRALVALGAVAALAGVGVGIASVHQRALSTTGGPQAHSGVWYCPHGGGPGWDVELWVTNPGPTAVSIRVSTFARRSSRTAPMASVPARSDVHLIVRARTRETSSEVEYFGGWVGVSWAARGGGTESGIASEPCASSLGRTWLMPDGSTLRGQDSWVVVMNPAAVPAIFSLGLDTREGPILTKDWADFVLPARRSIAFFLNAKALGRDPVGAVVQVQAGRVASASLGASRSGGIRATLGITAPERNVLLPSGADTGRSELVVDDAGTTRATYTGTVGATGGPQAIGQLRGETLQPGQAKAYDLTTQPDAAMDLRLSSGTGFAVVRRSLGPGSDAGSTAGAVPARAWVVPAATFSRKNTWRLVLSNPGSTVAVVKVWLLSTPGDLHRQVVRTLRVYAGQSHLVSRSFNAPAPRGAAVVTVSGASVVPLVASSTSTGGFATAVGVPIPARWVPTSPR